MGITNAFFRPQEQAVEVVTACQDREKLRGLCEMSDRLGKKAVAEALRVVDTVYENVLLKHSIIQQADSKNSFSP